MGNSTTDERAQRRADRKLVREYLYSIEAKQQRNGSSTPTLTPERAARIEERLTKLRQRIAVETSPMRKLTLVTQRIELEDQLAQGIGPSEEELHAQLEEQAIPALASWAQLHGIGWRALRSVGVPYRVLRQAGIDLETSV